MCVNMCGNMLLRECVCVCVFVNSMEISTTSFLLSDWGVCVFAGLFLVCVCVCVVLYECMCLPACMHVFLCALVYVWGCSSAEGDDKRANVGADRDGGQHGGV